MKNKSATGKLVLLQRRPRSLGKQASDKKKCVDTHVSGFVNERNPEGGDHYALTRTHKKTSPARIYILGYAPLHISRLRYAVRSSAIPSSASFENEVRTKILGHTKSYAQVLRCSTLGHYGWVMSTVPSRHHNPALNFLPRVSSTSMRSRYHRRRMKEAGTAGVSKNRSTAN